MQRLRAAHALRSDQQNNNVTGGHWPARDKTTYEVQPIFVLPFYHHTTKCVPQTLTSASSLDNHGG